MELEWNERMMMMIGLDWTGLNWIEWIGVNWIGLNGLGDWISAQLSSFLTEENTPSLAFRFCTNFLNLKYIYPLCIKCGVERKKNRETPPPPGRANNTVGCALLLINCFWCVCVCLAR